ncbi:MAG: alpha-ketoacid dehydrogenase subunit beta [Anaerolineae bacterium]|uniref:alpha-ketoacid dehydrogenase subunit beta n=1 Tax=Candidatus Amarolinea dominans TaxID=3140696 RepID=UPI001DF29A86|nr:alpha-ketoacid dehydrogenase subunit beta [Anaerolineae bacterium]MBK7200295.1 alpha-ketoacid dehydrogenase subunit beta [Anaerolineae bacterium]MBK9092140.1 alpha-ketoacid dehydrogenase subunit beta [Anaerolineae bacterium]MBK9231685.1 alpha-ketoacid dehydrogenase subunit beta [Anaerolineae bacterium]
MAIKTNIEALRDTMAQEMRRDPTIIITGEDVGPRGGVFRATQGLFAEFGPDRVIDSPLSELSIIAVGIGMALNGLRPICEIQFADFIFPAFNQIVSEAARFRYRSNGEFPVPMLIRAPYGGGISGGLYHSQSIEAFFCHMPGLYVVAPSTPYDMQGLLRAALRSPDPVLFLEHKKTYRLIKGEAPEGDYVVPIGKADIKRPGRDLTVIAYGLMLHEALSAAEMVAPEGIEVEVVDLRTLAPLDKQTILDSVKKTSKVVIVHEDTKTGGLAGEISAIIAEEAFEHLDGPITRVCAPDVPGVPFSHPMQDFYMPNANKIAAAIRQLAAY